MVAGSITNRKINTNEKVLVLKYTMSKTINKAKQTMTFAGTNETKPETVRSNFVVNFSNNAHNIVSRYRLALVQPVRLLKT